MRGLDDRQQFLFVNNCKPIRADKIRYYEERFFKERTSDYFHGASAVHEQRPGQADLPGAAHIDWKGVRVVGARPPPFQGVAAPAPAGAQIDPADYLGAQREHHVRSDYDDDGLS